MKQKMIFRKTFPLVVFTLVLPSVFAQELPAEKTIKPWKVEVSLGGVNTSGNTDTRSLQAKVDAKQTFDKWENQYVFSGLKKEEKVADEDGVKVRQTSAQKYFGSLKSSYLIEKKKSYLFGYGSYADDRFGAYRTYATVSAGYGNWLLSTPEVTWFAEVGPGYFKGKRPIDDTSDVYTNEAGAMLHVASELTWAIRENAELKQSLSVESSADNTRTIGEISLAASITDAMKMKIGINVANDSRVAPDKEKTDTTTFINLVYSL